MGQKDKIIKHFSPISASPTGKSLLETLSLTQSRFILIDKFDPSNNKLINQAY